MLSSDLQFPYSTQKVEGVLRRAADIAQAPQFYRHPYRSAASLPFLYRSLTQGKHRFVAPPVPYYSENPNSPEARLHAGSPDATEPFPLRRRRFLQRECAS